MEDKKPPLLDNKIVQPLVEKYKKSNDERERSYLFKAIALHAIPLIRWKSTDTDWVSQVNETDIDAIVSEITLKLPSIIEGFKPEKKKTFYSYLLKSIENKFRHWNRTIKTRQKYKTSWPRDVEGEPLDIADHGSVQHNSLETEQQKCIEFERVRFMLPSEIANEFPQPYQNLIRFIARRFLDRVDNKERLFITELVKEVSRLTMSKGLQAAQLENLVRMTIAIVRSNLYTLREEMTESECVNFIGEILRHGDPKIWPLLGVFNSVDTVKLLHCLAGVSPSVPSKNRFIKTSC